MQIKLAPEWKSIVTKAWSVRLIALATAFSALEILFNSLAGNYMDGSFAVASAVTSALAFVARIIAQQGLDE